MVSSFIRDKESARGPFCSLASEEGREMGLG